MRRISKSDIATLKAGLAYYNKNPDEYHCDNCPMSHKNNRLKIPCCDFLEELGGKDVYEIANDEGYEGQHGVIEYLIKTNLNRVINI